MFLLVKIGNRMAAVEPTLLFVIRVEIRVSEINSAMTKTFTHVSVSQNVAWGPPTTETPGVLF